MPNKCGILGNHCYMVNISATRVSISYLRMHCYIPSRGYVFNYPVTVHNSIKVPAMGVLNPDPHKF
jgi:hypothetical protein